MIYISGKVTGQKIEEARTKFLAAKKFLKGITKEKIINPLEVEVRGGLTWEEYMAKDIYWLIKCNKIYMLRDWPESKGARLEYLIAKELRIAIIYQK